MYVMCAELHLLAEPVIIEIARHDRGSVKIEERPVLLLIGQGYYQVTSSPILCEESSLILWRACLRCVGWTVCVSEPDEVDSLSFSLTWAASRCI